MLHALDLVVLCSQRLDFATSGVHGGPELPPPTNGQDENGASRHFLFLHPWSSSLGTSWLLFYPWIYGVRFPSARHPVKTIPLLIPEPKFTILHSLQLPQHRQCCPLSLQRWANSSFGTGFVSHLYSGHLLIFLTWSRLAVILAPPQLHHPPSGSSRHRHWPAPAPFASPICITLTLSSGQIR